jgi:hypothetical protein
MKVGGAVLPAVFLAVSAKVLSPVPDKIRLGWPRSMVLVRWDFSCFKLLISVLTLNSVDIHSSFPLRLFFIFPQRLSRIWIHCLPPTPQRTFFLLVSLFDFLHSFRMSDIDFVII